uniref:mitogen-activated protein kinase kinase n=1 Tax=Haptolina brevifila TaxID=156173 RepID=A0A7S2HM93_9EUKA
MAAPPRYKQKGKKVNLSIPTPAAVTESGVPVVSEGGSFGTDSISIGLQGLKVHELAACAAASSSVPMRPSGNPSGGDSDGDRLSLDEFLVVRDLGEGTSGVVKLVRHKPTGRKYAMKSITLGCSDQERKQILVEIRTLHKSDVPGIIAFTNAFYADNAVHIFLEYMDCGSLATVLRRHGRLPEPLLARVTSDVLGGLDHLHRMLKVVHRDIKPSNVLLNSSGEVKLADFGMSGQLASTFSRLASWVGTAAYMSPERISGKDYSFESDIWALGVSLWECSVGRYPYGTTDEEAEATNESKAAKGERPPLLKGGSGSSLLPGDEQKSGMTFWDLLYSIVECSPPPLPRDAFSDDFCELVHDCMRTEGTERPSAAKLLEHRWLSDVQHVGSIAPEWLIPDEGDD